MTVYRGVKGDYAKILKSVMHPGTSFVDRGFFSTSTNPSVASNFGGGLTMQIKMPKGTNAAAIGTWSGHHDEHEILLARNTIFHVEAVDFKTMHMVVRVSQEHLKS